MLVEQATGTAGGEVAGSAQGDEGVDRGDCRGMSHLRRYCEAGKPETGLTVRKDRLLVTTTWRPNPNLGSKVARSLLGWEREK